MAVVMGVLIISFGVWGIADIFRGFGQSTLAKVGHIEISTQQFRQLYTDKLQQIGRQFGRPLTMEQARAFERLSREFHMTQEQMAVRTGKDRATVANFLRLLRLPASVQVRVESGELSFGHARTLLAFEHAEEIEKAAQRIGALSLSVRQTESYVQGLLHPERASKKDPKPEPPVDPNVREVQDRLQRALGLKVHIEDHHGRGKVIIEYGRLEDFDTLLEQLAGE